MSTVAIDRLVVYGVGLIGGSFALALKQAGVVREVIGMGRGRPNLEEALRLGVIDSIGADDRAALTGADFVLLAMPVGQMGPVMQRIAPWIGQGAVVTDAGSTKVDVAGLARAHLAPVLRAFVPAHPIAGAEKSGAGAARAELFRDRHLIVTPLPETDEASVARVAAAWQVAGMHVTRMSPPEHDATLAAVSHLPHVLSFALVEELAGRADAERLFALAAGGFRDFTRIASSSPEMWRDICLANRAALLTELARYRDAVDRFATMIDRADGDGLERAFVVAREARARWLRIR